MGNNGAASDGSRARTEALLEALLRSQRRDRLCAEVARITAAPAPLVEDVFQEVCERVLRGKCRGQTIGEVYSWLQLATVRLVQERLELAHWRREVLVDTRNCDEEIDPPLGPSCEDEVIQREKERELSALVSTALADLDERHRSVAALHSHGFSGPAIATRLDTSERRVKHLIAETFAHSRDALVDAAGGGCQEGERLISRYSFGLANPSGRFAAQAHMASCDQCATLYRRLELAHEKIAALLPIPAVVEADPGLLEGVAHKGAHTLAQAKQQLAEAIGAAKQQAAAGYARAVEYTPLASARPGAAATAIAGCLALAGGTATYCVENNLNPVESLVDAVDSQPAESKPRPPEKTRVAQQTPDPPQPPPVAQPPAPAPAPDPAPEPVPAPAPVAPAPAPEPPPPPPPEPTPPAVQFGEPATVTPAPAISTPPPQPSRPAPVPKSGGTDLYGP
jgi:RNA polymerase sigma factor (sigma-70 family)